MVELTDIIVYLIPLIALQIVLIVLAVRDWLKQDPMMPNRNLWLLLIFVINMVGPIIYFLVAPRGYQTVDDSTEEAWT
jgi:hypothetical protein